MSLDTQDSGLIQADVCGSGNRGVVLAHGGRFDKGSWAPQARTLAAAGFRVVAMDFHGYGQSKGAGQADIFTAPLHLDVLAAVRYLRSAGVTSVSLVGASLWRCCRPGLRRFTSKPMNVGQHRRQPASPRPVTARPFVKALKVTAVVRWGGLCRRAISMSAPSVTRPEETS